MAKKMNTKKPRPQRTAEHNAKIGAANSKTWARKTLAERKAHGRKILLGLLRGVVEAKSEHGAA
jgi:hypothetical protein